jgi:hypothetical protein
MLEVKRGGYLTLRRGRLQPSRSTQSADVVAGQARVMARHGLVLKSTLGLWTEPSAALASSFAVVGPGCSRPERLGKARSPLIPPRCTLLVRAACRPSANSRGWLPSVSTRPLEGGLRLAVGGFGK